MTLDQHGGRGVESHLSRSSSRVFHESAQALNEHEIKNDYDTRTDKLDSNVEFIFIRKIQTTMYY
jgi:hypothetical protein